MSMEQRPTDTKAVPVEPDPFKQECWLNFLRGCQRSKATYAQYPVAVKHYMKFLGITDPAKQLEGNVNLWEKNLLIYLDKQVREGLSSHTMHFRISAVQKLYRKNKIKNIDFADIREAIPETKDRHDRPDHREEIQKALRVASLREKASILLVASSGIRDGGLATILKHDLVPIDRYGVYKIITYAGWKEEYVTFCTPEARAVIDEYFAFRERCGEKITENSPLFRDDFDAEDPVRASMPKTISAAAIADAVGKVMTKAGVRKALKLTEGQKAGAIRYEVKELYGLRKFFEITASAAGVNLAWVDMLMGHSLGIKKHYHKPTDDDLLEGKDRFAGYVAAIDSLTIHDDNRLKQKVKQLESENDRFELLEKKLALQDATIEKLKEMWLDAHRLTDEYQERTGYPVKGYIGKA